eukprot:TRINITY_DN24300_c0_g1_i1.p1 TRINITY_DN24300_c0_g1~~TRINITY_DN24300_c0_g1_i1.p1  ORF type:complete len:1062 (-),score=231.36 TRINITY_DN24300_c0_g1_i1:39-3224(-)
MSSWASPTQHAATGGRGNDTSALPRLAKPPLRFCSTPLLQKAHPRWEQGREAISPDAQSRQRKPLSRPQSVPLQNIKSEPLLPQRTSAGLGGARDGRSQRLGKDTSLSPKENGRESPSPRPVLPWHLQDCPCILMPPGLSPTSFELCVRSLPSMGKLATMAFGPPAARGKKAVGDIHWRAGLRRAMLIKYRFEHDLLEERKDDPEGAAPLPAEPEQGEPGVSEEAPVPESAQQPEVENVIKKKVFGQQQCCLAAVPEKQDWQPPTRSQDGLPSVKDALERYYQPPPVMPMEDELARMRKFYLRFKPKSVTEVSVEYIPMILDLLGYYTWDRPDEILLRYATCSFEDFTDAINERVVLAERQLLEGKIATWNNRGKQREQALVDFMHDLGAPCTTSSVEATLTHGLLCSAKLRRVPDTQKEVLRFLAARRSCEGFCMEERERLHEAFEECEVDDGGLIDASELSNALLAFAGLNCVEILKDMMRGVDFEGAPRVSFSEFVSFARILQTRQMKDIWKHMHAEDKKHDGLVSIAELRSMMIRVGYRLTNLEFKERLAHTFPENLEQCEANSPSVGCETDTDSAEETASNTGKGLLLSFDDVWLFVVDCWQCNGFAKDELEQHTKVFERFCGPEGEMGIVPVHRLLAYMGHENSLEKTRALAQMVDYNGNGTMDVGEFLTLMRLQKEENLKQFLAAYNSQDLGSFHIDLLESAQAALEECNLSLPDDLVISMMRKVRDDDDDENGAVLGMTFDAFVRLGEMCREIVPSKKRKQALFKIKEVEKLLEVFDSHCTSGQDWLSQSEFFALTAECPDLASNSAVQRNRLMAKVKLGWQAAKEAGVEEEELGDPQCKTIHFVPFLYVIRHLLEKHDAEVTEKLGTALVETGFSSQEVAEFREIFNQLREGAKEQPSKDESQQNAPNGKGSSGNTSRNTSSGAGAASRKEMRRRSQLFAKPKLDENEEELEEQSGKTLLKLMQQFTHVPCVPVDAVSFFIKSQTRLSSKQSKELGKYIVSLQLDQVHGKHGQSVKELSTSAHPDSTTEKGVDFPGFLRLMGWMTKSISSES